MAECSQITNDTVILIAENCPSLEILDLSWIGFLKNSGVAAVLSKCKNVAQLRLAGNKNLNEECLPGLCEAYRGIIKDKDSFVNPADAKYFDIEKCYFRLKPEELDRIFQLVLEPFI